VAAVAIGLLATLSLAWQQWQARLRDAWPQRMARVHQALVTRGWPVMPNQAPMRWAATIQSHSGPDGVVQLLMALEAWRYGAGADGGTASPKTWRTRWQEAQRWRAWWRDLKLALKAV
jgi:hypothetical protein